MLYGLAMVGTWCCRVSYMACIPLQNGPLLHTNTTVDPQNGPLNFGTGAPYTYIPYIVPLPPYRGVCIILYTMVMCPKIP